MNFEIGSRTLRLWPVLFLAPIILAFVACTPAGPAPGAGAPSATTKAAPDQAASSEWEKTVAEARKEGRVVVYASVAGPGVREAISPVLREKFGIELEVIGAPVSELRQRVVAERQRGLYLADVHTSGPDSMAFYKKNDALVLLEKALILPEVKDPAAWPGGKLPFTDKEGFGLPLTGAYWSYIAVNTDVIKPGDIKFFKDLIEPKWKGKMVMYDPSLGGVASNFIILMLKLIGGGRRDEIPAATGQAGHGADS